MGRVKRALLLSLCIIAAAGFAILGTWQLERRIWKLDLMARVDARVHAPPVGLPPPARWATVNVRDDEYRRVEVSGTFLHERATLVDALTERGPGTWVLTPLVTRQGTVLVNRGFVPDAKPDYRRPAGLVHVTGLMRMSEPGGRFLRQNQPAEDLWYSRDVAAIAVKRRIGHVAPFFIDAEAAGQGYPIGGMTVVRFRNTHLVYALTWFALAALAAFGAWRVYRDQADPFPKPVG